jgi:hypothetical protein
MTAQATCLQEGDWQHRLQLLKQHAVVVEDHLPRLGTPLEAGGERTPLEAKYKRSRRALSFGSVASKNGQIAILVDTRHHPVAAAHMPLQTWYPTCQTVNPRSFVAAGLSHAASGGAQLE